MEKINRCRDYWWPLLREAKEFYAMIVFVLLAVLAGVLLLLRPFEITTPKWLPTICLRIAGLTSLYMLFWLPVKRRESELKSCLEKLRKRNDAIRNMGADAYEALFTTTAEDAESTTMLREIVITCVSNLPPQEAVFWAGDAGFNQHLKDAQTKTWETAMAWLAEREACLKRQMEQLHVPE